MSRRWQLVGSFVAGAFFVYALDDPSRSFTAVLGSVPPLVAAVASAVGAYLGLYVFSGVVGIGIWMWRRRTSAPPSDMPER